MENYLTVQQRVVLYGQTSSWNSIQAGVPQGSVLVPLPFLIYVNDLPNGIGSICKIFVDDTSPFSKVKDETFSDTQLNNDLNKISKPAFQWKMLFNPDPKRETENYPSLGFNGTKVQLANSQKHFRVDFMQTNWRYNEKTFFSPVKKKFANNIQILRQA